MKLQDIIREQRSLNFDHLSTDTELTHQIQIRLIALGLLQGADGKYEPITKAALERFTKSFNLPQQINPITAKKLIEAKSLPRFLPMPGVELIKQFEGCYLDAYPDPLSGDKPITIGWGCTRKRDGGKWVMGDRITQAEADELLMQQLQHDYLPDLQKIPCWSELNENQQGALLSFAYNLGSKFFGSPDFQTMTKVLKNKQWHKIKDAFLLYCNPGSPVESGLRRRRQAEAELFLKPAP